MRKGLTSPGPALFGLTPPGAIRRRTISVSQESMVRAEELVPGQSLPLMVRPAVERLDALAWARSNRDWVEARLLEHGGLLFRGFDVADVPGFERFVVALCEGLLDYQDRVQPRSQVGGHVYTSTEYPPEQTIEFHNESAYAATWPRKVLFYCVLPAAAGGETPIADGRRVLAAIPQSVRDVFADKQLTYVRNFGEGFGITWQDAFQTEDREVMEQFCRDSGIEFDWRTGDRLRTRSRRPAIVQHPATQEAVWFNAAISSHVSTLEPSVRRALVGEFGEAGVPKNVTYGDGSPIEASALAAVRRAYAQETITFPWHEGDILLLDNMLAAHGRRPYRGDRKVVVGMAQPCHLDQVEVA